MRVLFVTEKFPYPLDTGGNVRSFHMLRALSGEHDVTVLATTQGEVQEAHVRELRKVCRDIRLVEVEPQTTRRDLAAFLRSLFGGPPFVLSRHEREPVGDAVRSCLGRTARVEPGEDPADRQAGFDAVHFNHLDAAVYEPIVPPGVLRILDEHNVVTNQVRMTLASEARVARRMVLAFERSRLARYEAETCNLMDLTLVCSQDDAQALRGLGVHRSIAVIPNGVDLDYFSRTLGRTGDRTTAVFLGTMDYEPCDTGVLHFCEHILPLVRRKLPALQLVVVGRNPSTRLRSVAAADPRIVLRGRVDDVRPHVQGAGVFVVPLLGGSGTRLKILEAMAMGVPIVTTSIGVEGIDAVHGRDIRVADAPEEFAAAVVGVLDNPQEAAALATSARALVERQYGWRAIGGRLLEEYRTLRDQRRVRCGSMRESR
jgi:polysaccharide biosynthesis protein PslH